VTHKTIIETKLISENEISLVQRAISRTNINCPTSPSTFAFYVANLSAVCAQETTPLARCLARAACLPRCLYVLLALMLISFLLKNKTEQNDLKICWTGFHQIFIKW